MERITPKEVETRLRKYLGRRSDLGLWNAIRGIVLQPRRPFQSESVRKPQQWLVLFLIFSATLLGAVVYFNFWN
jgi:hypothetical protein